MLSIGQTQMERYQSFRNCFIEYPQVAEIYSVLDRLMFNGALDGDQQSFLLTGDTGVGKSVLVNHYVAKHQCEKNRWQDSPILMTRVPSKVSEQDTLLRLLQDLDLNRSHRSRSKARNEALTEGVIKSLSRKKVRMVIVNEIQELMEFKKVEERQVVANTLKMISEEAGVPFVLVGMPYSTLLADESQWGSRLGWRRSLDYFRLFKKGAANKVDKESYMHFAKFVAGLSGRMGFKERPNLTSEDILLPLFAVCKGECRALKHFLADALLKSIQQSCDYIDKTLLAEVFSDKYPYADQNPFTCSVDDLKLRQLKSETQYNLHATTPEERLLERSFTDELPVSMLLTKRPLKA